ncbi:pilin [Paucibacter sp. O1-1]|nr:pilin [Paucibacter sp. O1-1]
MGSAIGTMNSLKAPVEAYILTEGEWPTTLAQVQGNNPANGTIAFDGAMTLTFTEGSPDIKNKDLVYNRTDDGVWSCDAGDIDDKYPPPLCQAVTP